MTRIKICGITHPIEIEYLNRYLPDYAGFVFAESRRRVTAEKAAALSSNLSGHIKKAGVFVDMNPDNVAKIAEQVGLDVLQLHGSEDEEYIRSLRRMLKPGTEIWKAIRVSADFAASDFSIPLERIDRIVLDSYVPGCPGGSGKSFDWSLALHFGSPLPIVLAGGLNPDNVRQAINMVRPFAVDVSSGVEGDGIKDEYKLKAFINAVRQ
jgi:phosphoribosylanthranilate isomerase